MPIRFCDCRRDQVPALKLFWARAYPPDYVLCRSAQLFEWQFLGPTGGMENGFNLKLAVMDGEVVGSLGYIPVEVSLGRGVVKGAWLANWVVDQERRRLGLGPLLMREVTSQFDVTLNSGPNEEARSVLSRMSWINVGPLTRYVLVLDSQAAATLTESGILQWPGTARARRNDTGVDVDLVSHFESGVTEVWDSLTSLLGAGTRRSAEYLNWRYIKHPVLNYRCFAARRRGDQVTGFAVYRLEQVRDRPARIGRIVELVGEEAETSALIDAMIADARAADVSLLDFFCSSPWVARSMHDSGFLSGGDSPAAQLPLLFQPLDYRRTAIHFMAYLRDRTADDVAHWYVTKSDADQDRPN